MRLTGADISSDTGCWRAAAFQNARSFRAVQVERASPIVSLRLCGVAVGASYQHRTSLYSDLPYIRPRFR